MDDALVEGIQEAQLPRSPCTRSRARVGERRCASSFPLRAAPPRRSPFAMAAVIASCSFTDVAELVEQDTFTYRRAVALALRLDRAVQRDDAWPATPSTYAPRGICRSSSNSRAGDRLASSPRRPERAIDLRNRATSSCAALFSRQRRGFARRQSLEMPDDRRRLRCPSPRVRGVTISRWSPARPTDATSPSCSQAVVCTDGCAAQSQAIGDARSAMREPGGRCLCTMTLRSS